MKILKTRTIAEIYPFLSLEAEVELNNGKIVYSNISVNNKGKQVDFFEDSSWTYIKPLNEIDWEKAEKYKYYLRWQEAKEIYEKLIEIWNNNPVFDNDYAWKPFNE